MPRVHHVKSARKDNPVAKRGESYYWWKFAFGPKRFSKTPPRRSQLTQSEYYSTMYAIEDNFDCPNSSFDEATGYLEGIQSEVEGVKDEIEEKIQNMEEHAGLAESPVHEQLEERRDALDRLGEDINEVIDTLNSHDPELEWEDEKGDLLEDIRAEYEDEENSEEVLEKILEFRKDGWVNDHITETIDNELGNINWEIE